MSEKRAMSNKTAEAAGAQPGEEQDFLLRVAEALPRDAGRALVRIDPQDLERLGAEIGDVVELVG